jgi:hypothetical protein
MKQTTLAAAGFEKHGRSTRKAEFLSRMDAVGAVVEILRAD